MEPDMIDQMSETELRTELRKLVNQITAIRTPSVAPVSVISSEWVDALLKRWSEEMTYLDQEHDRGKRNWNSRPSAEVRYRANYEKRK